MPTSPPAALVSPVTAVWVLKSTVVASSSRRKIPFSCLSSACSPTSHHSDLGIANPIDCGPAVLFAAVSASRKEMRPSGPGSCATPCGAAKSVTSSTVVTVSVCAEAPATRTKSAERARPGRGEDTVRSPGVRNRLERAGRGEASNACAATRPYTPRRSVSPPDARRPLPQPTPDVPRPQPSVLQTLAQTTGSAPKVLLPDSASEIGTSPVVD